MQSALHFRFGDHFFFYKDKADSFPLQRKRYLEAFPQWTLCEPNDGALEIEAPPIAERLQTWYKQLTLSVTKRLSSLGYIPLHVGTAMVGDCLVFICGDSGVGKSLIALALYHSGFKVFADDICFAAMQGTNLEIVPYPKKMKSKSPRFMGQWIDPQPCHQNRFPLSKVALAFPHLQNAEEELRIQKTLLPEKRLLDVKILNGPFTNAQLLAKQIAIHSLLGRACHALDLQYTDSDSHLPQLGEQLLSYLS